MKPIFPLFILLQVVAFLLMLNQSSLLPVTINHDSTGFFLVIQLLIFIKAPIAPVLNNFTRWICNIVQQIQLYHMVKMLATFNLSKRMNTYNANYSLRIQYLGNLYNNLGVNTHTYQFDYYYNGIQLDSSIGIYTDVIANNTYKYYNTFYHYNGLNQMDTTWTIFLTM
ncbi:MAG: hypothetical protein IPJ31_16610 [Bacteroidetes bacterium]|nr:hypothetical protein [Bacteroidota bacterium]